MLQSLRSPAGRIVFALVGSLLLVLATLLLEPGMIAITPAFIAPIWISVIGTDRLEQHRRLLLGLAVAGSVTLLLGVAAYLVVS